MAFKFKRALTAGGDNAIHILGIGNLGKYVAHALMKQHPRSLAPITLLFHRKRLLADWNNGGRVIQCITHGKVDRRGGFKVEVLPDSDVDGTLDTTPIKNLIVATRSYATTSALDLIKHRLDKESDVIFLQNGMGIVEEVSEQVFPDPRTRPRYWAGVYSTGSIHSTAPFHVVHTGRGSLLIGLVGDSNGPLAPDAVPSNHMLQQLLHDDILGTELVSPEKIKRAQLRKLVVSSIIDPLTVLFNCTNGEVFNSKPRMALLRLLVRETGRIARGLLDDLSDEDWQVFSGNPLRDLVVSVSAKTSQSTNCA
ncbi:putative 2-dehydropantoate 2-reductase [Madurella mycetomatis]|uniref:2-dehydropantoate 2-reductase n=1 Tax=Madurella mycetomatis TaxID=100816 RepID=A0A175W6Q1_9PEZI|nr:putative 2-dehydropantoate 2-reductase [Madurella mycetomatis]